MGQAFLLHVWVSLASPMQSLPPYFGDGSLHNRLRVWEPPPHVREQVSHGDQGPQLPLTEEYKEGTCCIINWYPFCIDHTNVPRLWISDGGTYWGTKTSDTSRFVGPLLHTLCPQAEGLGSCRGGYGWWHPHHRWQSMMTRVTNGSSCHPAWLKDRKIGQRSVIRK